MAFTKNPLKLVFHALLLVILFFAFIAIFISGTGAFFYLELLGFLVLLILTITGFVNYTSRQGEIALFLVYVFYLLNLFLVWYFRGYMYVVLVILAFLGFLLSIPRRHRHAASPISSKSVGEPHSMVFDVPPAPPPAKELEEKGKMAENTPRSIARAATFTPGKFVASNQSNQFHAPKCDWAKKIKSERRVWFKSKEEAWNRGYKAHSCIQ